MLWEDLSLDSRLLRALPSFAEIDTSETPELGDRFWANAKMVKPITNPPRMLSPRIERFRGQQFPERKTNLSRSSMSIP